MNNDPWLIHFLQRHSFEDPQCGVPAAAFLDTLGDKVVAEIQAVLDAVAKAPPLPSRVAVSGRSCTTRCPASTRCECKVAG